MTEWQRLSFSSTYEMPRRIVSQLNQITEGLKAFASAGQAAADDLYELAYRDHLLQRFYRIEAGTVQMTTNLYVDLRELFVMPRIKVRAKKKTKTDEEPDADVFMKLSEARAVFGKIEEDNESKEKPIAALEQIKRSKRNIIVGLPGGGKSTLFEWLQLSLASADEEFIAGDGQAIPLLLRVRQVDPKHLPNGADLIEKATASRDRAILAPPGWIERQFEAGRIFLMLDGLDETEPGIRDKYIIPWLAELCKQYPQCHYLLSSRPVGYRPGSLRELGFTECDLDDFGQPEIAEFTRHWCTAIRLARNDPDEEARREGAKEGDEIVAGFKGHPYIRNLARNPLMLSAICLVNYFEGGQLPKDRVVLYRLCVEGLLHHWDQRRGIRSEYSLEEKLRVSREIAIAMQKDDRAEYEAAKVLAIFTNVLKNKVRAKSLLEHIRYRTGLLIERRAGVFAFAHLTFQEYLAARSVYEGNHLKIDCNRLAVEHSDGRWNEVIALFCGLASSKAAREMIETLIGQPNTRELAAILAEAFSSATSELTQDRKLRCRVIERIAISPSSSNLKRFSPKEVAPVANALVGKAITTSDLSESYWWLSEHYSQINWTQLVRRLKQWRKLIPFQMGELNYLTHRYAEDKVVGQIANLPDLYRAQGLTFNSSLVYDTQAEIAFLGLTDRLTASGNGLGTQKALLQILRTVTEQKKVRPLAFYGIERMADQGGVLDSLTNAPAWAEYVSLGRKLAARFEPQRPEARALKNWATAFEAEMNNRSRKTKKRSSTKPKKIRNVVRTHNKKVSQPRHKV